MNESEIKICQNCKTQFTIEPEDFDFYKRINVPPPTFCWKCRAMRRMAFRDMKTVYKRKVIGSDKEIFSVFHPDSPFKVYAQDYWFSDNVQPASGRTYDFSKPFFEQFRSLMLESPWQAGYNLSSKDSEWCNNCFDVKNCYLAFNSAYSEDSAYVVDTLNAKECFDVLKVESCALSYELFDCKKCYKTLFSSHCMDCVDVLFSENLVGCSNCFGCVNLRRKSYYIFNEPYDKDEYFKKIKEFKVSSYSAVESLKEEMRKRQLRFPVRYYHGFNNSNVIGDYIDQSKNCRNVFFCRGSENLGYSQLVFVSPGGKDSMDICVAAGELCYEVGEIGGYSVKFSWYGGTSKMDTNMSDVEYSMNCFNSHHLFGCVGMKNAEYCIMNKHYSKKEYDALVARIKKHMDEMSYTDKKGRIYRYGEFFPPDFSPFGYNETLAQEYFPMKKDAALENGFEWKERPTRDYAITINSESVPDMIGDSHSFITKETIECIHKGKCSDDCSIAFRIIPGEFEFHRRLGVSLPRLCSNCRYAERLKLRNVMRLWKRRCQCAGVLSGGVYKNTGTHFHGSVHCPNEFETSYAPDRPEIVYCEQCYNAEVA